MMVSDKTLANAMGGKTARACDNCISKRARWYCPADDAFLCHECDSSIHSANPLARRHERVRLKMASMKLSRQASLEISVPSWHGCFTRKARTPRNKKHAKAKFDEQVSSGVNTNPLDHVPEICSDDNSQEEDDDQLLYRVPTFDPFLEELCSDPNSSEVVIAKSSVDPLGSEIKLKQNDSINDQLNQLHGSLPSEMDLSDFAADVESLLGKGLDDESFDIEDLGFSDCKEIGNINNINIDSENYNSPVKIEDGGEMDVCNMADDQIDFEIDVGREPFELSFDFDSSMGCEDDKNKVEMGENCSKIDEASLNQGKKILLRLDYEGVMTAWADQKSPWTTGDRPELDPYGCWPICMGACGTIHSYGEMFGQPSITDGGREARVSRYREKRRTRLFSKKIRYEVRKLNAEKRPRMKGRFVKRANLSASAFPLHNK